MFKLNLFVALLDNGSDQDRIGVRMREGIGQDRPAHYLLVMTKEIF